MSAKRGTPVRKNRIHIIAAIAALVIVISGCASAPNHSSEVGNPNPTEGSEVTVFASAQIAEGIELEFDAELDFDGIQLMREDDLLATIAVTPLTAVITQAVQSLEPMNLGWNDVTAFELDGQIFAIVAERGQVVIFDIIGDLDLSEDVRLTVTLPDVHRAIDDIPYSAAPDASTPNTVPVMLPRDGWSGTIPFETVPFDTELPPGALDDRFGDEEDEEEGITFTLDGVDEHIRIIPVD